VPEAIAALQTSAALCADWRSFDAAERHLAEAEGWCRRLREGETLPLMVTLGHWLPMRCGGAGRLMWGGDFRGVPGGSEGLRAANAPVGARQPGLARGRTAAPGPRPSGPARRSGTSRCWWRATGSSPARRSAS
jgi:hypothetical protein